MPAKTRVSWTQSVGRRVRLRADECPRSWPRTARRRFGGRALGGAASRGAESAAGLGGRVRAYLYRIVPDMEEMEERGRGA